jgi:hypothetical protein
MMHIGWPQGIYLTIIMIATAIDLAKAGDNIPDRWATVVGTLLARPAALGLLYWGGFFG